MRKFALVILNNEDKIIDKYSLDFVTAPTDLGFRINLSILSGETQDTITKIEQARNTIKFTINQYQYSYEKANSLALWIQSYSTPENIMALEYDDGTIVRYCEGRVIGLGKGEKSMIYNLQQSFEFLQTSPFFVKRENTIKIKVSAVGKTYPFTYPYSYGRNMIENNGIENNYIKEVPLILKIDGAIITTGLDNVWAVELVDENGNSFSPKQQIAFNENLPEGSSVIINSAHKKVYLRNSTGDHDYSQHVSPKWDGYLLARQGKSKLKIYNMNNAVGIGFALTGNWREYRL